MKQVYTSLLFLFCSCFVTLEAMYHKGFVVTHDGKEISGRITNIYYSDWRSEVTFVNEMGRSYQYHPATIKGFVYEHRGEQVRYVSKVHRGRWLFMRVLYVGEQVVLYRSPERKRQMVRQISGYSEMDLLSHEYWVEMPRKRPFQIYPLTYKKTLRQKFSRHPELVAKLGSPGYRYRDMAEIIREYDELQKSNRSSL